MSGANSKDDDSKQSGPASGSPASGPPSSRPPDSVPGSGDGGPVSERRGGYRHLACFPAHLHTEAGVTRTALIRDLSVSGALLLTRAAYTVGDPIKLSLYLTEGAEPTLVQGKVVRSARRTGELAHPWTRSVAVRFDQDVKELEPVAKELAEKQAALFAKKA